MSRDISATRLPRWRSFDMIRNTYADIRICAQIYIYIYTYTCRCSRFRPSPCSRICRYPRCVLQRNSANHSRAYSDACHNERRATFCFGPVGRKYRPFWIFNFQRSSKPLRGAPPPSTFPLTLPVAPRSPVAPLPSTSSCRARMRERIIGRECRLRGISEKSRIFRKISIKVEQTLVKIWRAHSIAFSKDTPSEWWQRVTRYQVTYKFMCNSSSAPLPPHPSSSASISSDVWAAILISADFLLLALDSAYPRAGIHFSDGRFLWAMAEIRAR